MRWARYQVVVVVYMCELMHRSSRFHHVAPLAELENTLAVTSAGSTAGAQRSASTSSAVLRSQPTEQLQHQHQHQRRLPVTAPAQGENGSLASFDAMPFDDASTIGAASAGGDVCGDVCGGNVVAAADERDALAQEVARLLAVTEDQVSNQVLRGFEMWSGVT
jgi:hypothetical protein